MPEPLQRRQRPRYALAASKIGPDDDPEATAEERIALLVRRVGAVEERVETNEKLVTETEKKIEEASGEAKRGNEALREQLAEVRGEVPFRSGSRMHPSLHSVSSFPSSAQPGERCAETPEPTGPTSVLQPCGGGSNWPSLTLASSIPSILAGPRPPDPAVGPHNPKVAGASLGLIGHRFGHTALVPIPCTYVPWLYTYR